MSILNRISTKNKNLLLFGLIVVVVSCGFIFPPPVSAGLITSALLSLPGIVLALFGFFTNLFARLSVLIFNWVTGPTFISWGYTQNPVIKVGLGITKQFVNMGLVVVLIFIALAIALRLKEYASQKTLIRLIAVALLVNFAPVICGLIVDATNIVMNYFLSAIQTGVTQILGGLGKSFEMFLDIMSIKAEPKEQLGNFGRLGVSIMFNAVIGFTFILLAVIFIVRYIAIWVLVILAPLAFVAWILPATKKFWDQWWQQFIQWSIIGIPLAFFVYLAMNSLGALQMEFGQKMSVSGLGTGVTEGANYFNEFFGYMIVVVMIWLGILIGLQTSAMGANSIISFAKTKGKTGAKWAARRIPEGTAAATAGALRGIKEGKGLGRITGAFKGAATYEGREKGREVMGRMLEKAHLVRPGAYETARRKRWKIEEETKRLDALPTDRLREIAHRAPLKPADRRGAIAAFEVLAKRSALKDEEKGLLPKMQSFGADTKQALKARPDWGSLIGKTTEDTKKQIEGTTRRDFTNHTQAEALKNEGVVIHLDSSKVQDIRSRGSTEQRNALNNTIKEIKTYGPAFKRSLAQARKIQQEADQLRQEKKPGWEKEFEKKTKEWHIISGGLKKIKLDPNF